MNGLGSLLSAMASHGLLPGDGVDADGELHRFHVEGDRAGSRNGWYTVYPDHRPAAVYGTWRTGERHTWRADSGHSTSHADREAIRRQQQHRDRARAEAQQAATSKAAALWRKARDPDLRHPYLRGKGVAAHGIRQLGDNLLVPLQDIDGNLWNLQTITPTGEKRFLRGGRVRGLFHVLGPECPKFRTSPPAGRVWLCEGYATGASMAEDFREPVVVAFNCGNLMGVAETLVRHWRGAQLAVMADDDYQTPGNPGVTAAKAVADKLGVRWHVPEFPPRRPAWASDYNDCARLWRTQRVSA